MTKIYDFIIVGGGSSGLVTANKLINKGFKVLVIEEGTRSNNLFFQCRLLGKEIKWKYPLKIS